MRKYISILRGINVGGQKKIKMDDLKSLYRSLKLFDVTSYIQSGNLIFCTPQHNLKKIKKLIENTIEKKFNFFVHVQILSEKYLHKIISDNPFSQKEIDFSKLYITFLDNYPEKSLLKGIQDFSSEEEEFIVKGKVIYFYCLVGYGKTKLNNNFFEKKLNVNATTRNWKTSSQLYKMLKEKKCE